MATIAELLVKVGIDSSQVKSGMDKVANGIEKAEGKIKTAGAVAGGAMVAGFVGAMEVEKANDKLAASLALTESESERVGSIAGELFSSGYGQNIGDVNAALAGVISRTEDLGSMTDSELQGMGTAALNFAETFDTDVARATQVAGQLVTEGLASDFEHAFDIMTAGSQQTAAGMQTDVLDASDEYGKFFETMGFTGEEAFGLLAESSQKGMHGIDKTGDAIKEFSLLSTEMKESTVEAFDSVGLDAEEMAGKFLEGGDTAREGLNQTIDGLLGMEDPAAQAQAAVDLFGTPIEDLNKAEIPDFLESLKGAGDGLGDVEGAAGDLDGQLRDNTATAFSELARTAKSELMAAVEPMIPTFNKILDVVIPLAPFIVTLAGAVLTLVAAIKIIRAIIVVVTAVQWLWNIAMMANPIGIVIALILALIAVVVLIIVFWDEIVAFLTEAWNMIKVVAIAVWGAITEFFAETWEKIKAGVAVAWEWVKEKISMVWTAIKVIFKATIAAIKEAIQTAWDWIKETTSTVWNGIKDFFTGIWNGIKDFISGAISGIKDTVSSTWNTIKDNVSDSLSGIKDTIKSIWDWAVDKVDGAVDDIKGFFSGMWNGIKNGLKSALNGAIGLINGAIGGINTLIDGANKVPGVSIPHVPSIPYLAEGGDILSAGWAVVGEAGPEMLKMPKGAQVRPLDDEGGSGGGDREVRFVFEGDEDMIRMFRRAIRVRGGLNVVFGRS